LCGGGNSLSLTDLPSWCPDWRYYDLRDTKLAVGVFMEADGSYAPDIAGRSKARSEGIVRWRAAGDTLSVHTISEDLRDLTVRGFEIDGF
jgi:hypothetical protein